MKSQEVERAEAIGAADEALTHLYRAKEKLRSAGNWGIADMLGGGAIVSLFKHSKIDDARSELGAAKSALSVFVRELRDVDASPELTLDFNGLLTAADIFFDNTLFDVMAQFEIARAKEQVDIAIGKVEVIKQDLLYMS